MELDDYKIAVDRKGPETFSQKGLPELSGYLRGQTLSSVDKIKRNLKLETGFAGLFFIFNGLMLFFFNHVFYLRIFTFLLLIFCLCFIYYVIKLLRYIQLQYTLDTTVTEQLVQYIHIIARFTRLYFQLTIVIIPLIFLTAFTAVYLDQARSGNFTLLFSSRTIRIYFGVSVGWSVMMYFFARWYIKKLYGNHLTQLKELLQELQEVK